jgi:hypothetical protein
MTKELALNLISWNESYTSFKLSRILFLVANTKLLPEWQERHGSLHINILLDKMGAKQDTPKECKLTKFSLLYDNASHEFPAPLSCLASKLRFIKDWTLEKPSLGMLLSSLYFKYI